MIPTVSLSCDISREKTPFLLNQALCAKKFSLSPTRYIASPWKCSQEQQAYLPHGKRAGQNTRFFLQHVCFLCKTETEILQRERSHKRLTEGTIRIQGMNTTEIGRAAFCASATIFTIKNQFAANDLFVVTRIYEFEMTQNILRSDWLSSQCTSCKAWYLIYWEPFSAPPVRASVEQQVHVSNSGGTKIWPTT